MLVYLGTNMNKFLPFNIDIDKMASMVSDSKILRDGAIAECRDELETRRAKANARAQRFRKKHRVEINLAAREYREANKEAIKARRQQRYYADIDESRRKARERVLKHYYANIDESRRKLRERAQKYREKYRDEINAKQREYYRRRRANKNSSRGTVSTV